MEIPDIIVVNKADHPLADTMVREVRAVLALGPQRSWRVPVVRTEAARGEGVAELVEKIGEHRAHIEEEGTLDERRARNLRAEVLGHRRRADAPRARGAAPRRIPSGPELLDSVVSRETDPATAAGKLLERVTRWLSEHGSTRHRRAARRVTVRGLAGSGREARRDRRRARSARSRARVVTESRGRSGCWRAWAASATTAWCPAVMRSPPAGASGCPTRATRSAGRPGSSRSAPTATTELRAGTVLERTAPA